ncbi:MAG: pyrimidine-nucleoside phosphorylase [Spirochaetales bacterium]|nr:pyrimidine-nucleoside phosphorylase [Spirochaetales bacterium]
MHIIDVIKKKQAGEPFTLQEIEFFIRGYIDGDIHDYQIAALLMAIWFKGMDNRETTDLTLTMMRFGDIVDLSAISGIKVDKHSTGGVADTTTLISAPLVAACGGKVAKISGRGLGHTGGTLDKLESIPGLSVEQSMERFAEIVSESGIAIIGQTANLVPADKKLYALRDVTGTIDNLSLIASSVMSKKLASGSDAIVLDVKTGSGAFMRKPEDAEELARVMVAIGNRAGKRTLALVTDMNQPLGMAIGNALEVQEAIEILDGKIEGALKEVSLALGAQMLIVSDLATREEEALEMLENSIENGEGKKRFARMIEAQGGDPRVVDDIGLLPQAQEKIPVLADREGFIGVMSTADLGVAALLLGAGRLTKSDVIDPAVGIWMKKRIGDEVAKGEELATFYVNNRKNLDEAEERFKEAITITRDKPAAIPLIYAKIEGE